MGGGIQRLQMTGAQIMDKATILSMSTISRVKMSQGHEDNFINNVQYFSTKLYQWRRHCVFSMLIKEKLCRFLLMIIERYFLPNLLKTYVVGAH